MSKVEDVLAKVTTDAQFRSRVVANAPSTLSSYHLSDTEQQRVLDEATMLSGGVQDEVAETEVLEEGQADAAGAKA